MFRHFTLFLAFFVCLPALVAQEIALPTFEWGAVQEANKGLFPLNALSTSSERFIYRCRQSRGFKGPDYVLNAYNEKLDLESSLTLNLGEKKSERRSILSLIEWRGNLCLFSTFTNKKTKKRFLFLETLDADPLAQTNDLRPIAEIDFDGYKLSNAGSFGLNWSLDSNKLMVLYDLPVDKDKPERFGFHVFDSDLNQTWKREVELPYSEKRFKVAQQIVDEEGSVYVIGRYYNNPNWAMQAQPDFDLTVLIYHKEQEEPVEHRLDVGQDLPVELRAAVVPSGDMICTGFYAKKGQKGLKGAYYMRVDRNTGSIVSNSTMPFTPAFIRLGMTDKEEQRSKRKSGAGKAVNEERYSLNELIVAEDGGVVLVAEREYITVHTVGSGENQSTVTKYHYDDIVLIQVTPEGSIAWADKIPKAHTTRSFLKTYMSYGLATSDELLYIFYNDHPENQDFDGSKKLKAPNFEEENQPLVVAVYNSEGLIGKEVLTTYGAAGVTASPAAFSQLSDGRILMYGLQDETYRLGMMTLP